MCCDVQVADEQQQTPETGCYSSYILHQYTHSLQAGATSKPHQHSPHNKRMRSVSAAADNSWLVCSSAKLQGLLNVQRAMYELFLRSSTKLHPLLLALHCSIQLREVITAAWLSSCWGAVQEGRCCKHSEHQHPLVHLLAQTYIHHLPW